MKPRILFVAGLLLLCVTCETTGDKGIKKDLFSGYVQKGPFINGSAVVIAELDEDLNQTGRIYNSVIEDNSGKFEQKNIELISDFVELRADGFYFNENSGEKSLSQLTLYAITDLSDENNANVNILTHLEKSRTEYLVSQMNYLFEDAKEQAQQEVLKIFSIDKTDIVNSEHLNLENEGDNNAILLAVSVIVQGYRSTADMSELLANIATDIRADGLLTDSSLGSRLIEDAELLDLVNIRTNIEERYQELGITTGIPDFEKYVALFIENTAFVPEKHITYPVSSDYGINILNDNVINIDSIINLNMGYSMAAILPAGTSLKIIMKDGIWAYCVMPQGPVNWTVSQYDDVHEEQTFIATESGKCCDLKIQFAENDTITIEFYENNATVPTKTKQLFIPDDGW